MLVLMSILVPLAIGFLLMLTAPRLNLKNYEGASHAITPTEFGVVTGFTLIIAVLVTVVWGPSAARASATNGYKQFLNGSIVYAGVNTTTCTRDGSCRHEYDCDLYYVTVTYTVTVSDGVDSKGNPKTRTETRTRQEPRYHRCPYVTKEFTYYLNDSLGRTITIASSIFAENPQPWRGNRVSSDVSGVARGIPARWATSKARLESGDAEPVTNVGEYTNYILPSESAVLKSFSSQISQYKQLKLMPAHTANINHPLSDYGMQATKVQFVGLTAPNLDTWQDRLMRFNAALGMERRGDLHIVVVPASKVTDPDAYAQAVKTYWQYSFGKWGFPKNGIMLLLGASTDGTQVTWARAKTGMPIGNGEMLTALQLRLTDVKLDPDVVLGRITATAKGKKVSYTHSQGIADVTMFRDFPFLRACMACKDKVDNGTSYVYLKDEIPVSTSSKLIMFFIVLFISLAGWAVALFTNVLPFHRTTSDVGAYPSNRYGSNF